MFSEVDITLNIKNNRSYTQTINVMGNPYNLLDTSNAKTEYRWNVTTFVFTTETSISLEYKKNSEPTFTTYTSDLDGQNFQAVVTALNNLGIGYFNTYTELGQTYISTNNDNYQFGILDIGAGTFAGEINLAFTTNGGTGFTVTTGVNTIAQQNDGKIVVGGTFNGFDGNTRFFILRLNYDGSFDNTFGYAGSGFNTPPNNIALQSDGKIIAVGNFIQYNGNPVNGIVRINADGTFDSSFLQGTGFAGGFGQKIAIQSDGKILIAGTFTSYNGNSAGDIVRLNSDGTYDNTFNSTIGTNGVGITIAIQNDGKIILGGGFTTYNGSPASRIVRINLDGSYDSTFNSIIGFDNTVQDLVIQSDGKIVACGFSFTSYNGNSSNRIARINTDGSYDSTFNVGTGLNGLPEGIALQSNGKIFVVGIGVTNYNGNAINGIVRINTDGSNDNTFNQGSGFGTFPDGAYAIYYSNINGQILVGGTFTIYDVNPSAILCQINTISPA
jgi:uncharacterized delta-60 repeat protein